MSYFCEQCTQAERDAENVLYIHEQQEHCLVSRTAYSYHSSNGNFMVRYIFPDIFKHEDVNVYLLYFSVLDSETKSSLCPIPNSQD